MTFRKVLCHTLTVLLAAALLACCWYGHHASRSQREGIRCMRLKVEVKDSPECIFIAREDLERLIERSCGNFIGKQIDSVDVDAVEKAVLAHTAVRSAQAYVCADSSLNVIVTQKEPILRLQRSDGGFYVDRDGQPFPLQARGTAAVPIVDGFIPENLSQEWLDGILALEKYIQSSKTWRDIIIQVHVQKNGDLVLIPREGREKFIFGGASEHERKFRQMELYYTAVKPSKEEGYYGSVNLKFADQIICRR